MTRPDDVWYRFKVAGFATLRFALAMVVLVALLAVPTYLLGSGVGTFVGVALFAIGVLAMAAARGIETYPAHTFGVQHRVDEDTFDGPRKHCAECGTTTNQGLRRRYTRQFVVLGFPLYTLDWGINDYCLDCAEPGGGPGIDPDSAIGRVRKRDESAKRELERAFEE